MCGRPARAKTTALAQVAIRDATAGRRGARLVRAVNDLHALVEATERIIEQTRLRLTDRTPDSATRVVSLFDTLARPIAKADSANRSSSATSWQVVDNDDGIVLDRTIELGNPPDAPQLAPAILRITHQAGRTPRTVTADRGDGEASVEQQLTDRGVGDVVVPRKGNPVPPEAVEHRPSFRRTVKWRTGCEGRISTLKRGYGWDRTRLDSLEGARTWTGRGS